MKARNIHRRRFETSGFRTIELSREHSTDSAGREVELLTLTPSEPVTT